MSQATHADPFEMTAAGDSPPGRPTFRATPQQEDFFEELLLGTDHVLLEARAGSGKSSSCREGMWRLIEAGASPAIRYCCFNKKIADEFGEKCPPGVDVGTMHRFGLQALQRAFNSGVDEFKSYTLMDGMEGGPALKRYIRKSVATLVSHAKGHGIAPDDPELPRRLAEYVVAYDVETWRQQDVVFAWVARVLAAAAETTSVVDFDDMVWLPVVHGVRFPGVDYLFIDECQDLSRGQHMLAERLAGSGRTIVVGDPYQAVYGWRGADCDSIPRLRDRLGARTLPLTVTFRCPRKHVELARRLVPDFEASPEAPEGELVEGPRELIDAARPGDLVLCRSNAPIVAACLRHVASGMPAVVRGRKIGDSLVSVVRKVGDADTIPRFVRALAAWRGREVARLEAKDGTETLVEECNDRAACLEAIASSCSSPAEIPGAISRLFDDADSARRVTFSSVHRAKGSEARRVTYLQIPYSETRDRLRPPQEWEHQQRRNLRYVALSRSLESLTLVS